MPLAWRARTGQWLVSGGYLLLLGVAAELESVSAWTFVAGAIAVLALLAWKATLRRLHGITDTPTSSVATAAQGYVELRGRGRPLAGDPLLSPLSQLPCPWYRYRVERRQGKRWVTESSGESSASFLLDDGSGECVLDPEGAEVMPARTERRHRNGERHTESLILVDDALYVLGHFQTRDGSDLALDLRADLARRLDEWKADMPALIAKHDRNGDGHIDQQEWEAVREQARQEVEAEHRAWRALPGMHTLGRPTDGRPYLISTLDPQGLVRRLRLWSALHARVFLGALAALGHGWMRF